MSRSGLGGDDEGRAAAQGDHAGDHAAARALAQLRPGCGRELCRVSVFDQATFLVLLSGGAAAGADQGADR